MKLLAFVNEIAGILAIFHDLSKLEYVKLTICMKTHNIIVLEEVTIATA